MRQINNKLLQIITAKINNLLMKRAKKQKTIIQMIMVNLQ